jgi:hypothetical protein
MHIRTGGGVMMCWFAGMSSLLLLLSGNATASLAGTTRQAGNTVQSDQSRPVGGVQLDVEPRRAQVFVDGAYKGIVDDFRGYYQHLTLPAGRHRIEILESGYLPLIFRVTVVPDRTITYRWSLQDGLSGW